MPRTTKSAKASTSAAEKIQDESSAHEESSSSDEEQDPEVFIQPPQAQLLPNMFMPYIEGPKMDWTVNLVYTIESLHGTCVMYSSVVWFLRLSRGIGSCILLLV